MRPGLLALLILAVLAPASSAVTLYGTIPSHGGVNDGDTVDFLVNGKGKKHHIRFNGVQAQEMTRYSVTPSKWRGECHAVEAARFVLKMVKKAHYKARISADVPKTDTLGRWERFIDLRIGGKWVDLGAEEMRRGLTLWLHNTKQEQRNVLYNRLGQQAALKGIGMFDTDTCGAGPQQDAQLKVWVMSDPVGEDFPAINTEYVRVQNLGLSTVSLTGWYLHDGGTKHLRYSFPKGASIPAGGFITIRTGTGTNDATTFYRGLANTQFENSANGDGAGDGAYMVDPDGDVRAWSIYPCLVSCTDPNQGALRVKANPISGPEYVDATNISNHDVSLFGYELRLPGAYAYPPDAVVHPGETIRVWVKGEPSTDTRLVKHIGYDGAYLDDPGGFAAVTNFQEVVIGCDSWGSEHC